MILNLIIIGLLVVAYWDKYVSFYNYVKGKFN